MKKWLRRAGIGVGSLVLAVVLGLVVVYAASEVRFRHAYDDVAVAPFRADNSPAAVERGRHLVTAVAKCTECHGQDLGGTVFIDVRPLGTVIASNLTRGKGGVAGRYTDGQLERAIRHGVNADGRPLAIMPAAEYYAMSDQDLQDVIAYVRSVPPVDHELPGTTIRTVGRALYLAGKLPLFAAEDMNHHAARTAVPAGVTVEYGKYLATIGGCTGCHGPDLAGRAHNDEPGAPPPANLTPRGELGTWTEQDFFTALRTGRRPNGSRINTKMPWQASGKMTDDEIRAVWMYLKSVPPRFTPTD
jgi:cytochrome c553